MYRCIGINRKGTISEVRDLGKACSFGRAMATANEMRENHEITAVFEEMDFVVGVNGTNANTEAMMEKAKNVLRGMISLPLYHCLTCATVGVDAKCFHCKQERNSLSTEQKNLYIKHGEMALRPKKKFLLWKDEGGRGPVTFHDTDPDLPREFVFTASAPIGKPYVVVTENDAPVWITKRAAKSLAKTMGAEFREG